MPNFEPSHSLTGRADSTSEVAGRHQVGSKCPYCPSTITIGAVVRVCPDCRAVHHNACWKKHGRCGAFECATARNYAPPSPPAPSLPSPGPVLVITGAELARAEPLPAGSPIAPPRPIYRTAPTGPPVNRLAITAFVTAIAGIPFFGALTGLAAVGMAIAALFGIDKRRERGKGLAIAALALGAVDVVGWIIFLTWSLAGTDLREIIRDKARRQRAAGHVMTAPAEPRAWLTMVRVAEDGRKSSLVPTVPRGNAAFDAPRRRRTRPARSGEDAGASKTAFPRGTVGTSWGELVGNGQNREGHSSLTMAVVAEDYQKS